MPKVIIEIYIQLYQKEKIMAESYNESAILEEDTQSGRFLSFSLEDEMYGIEIKNVTEIIGMQPINKIPEVPDYVKGIINLRGKIIPLIDMRLKFGMQPIEYNDRTCIVVININEVSIGLIVDNVDEVITIDGENISQPPSNKIGYDNKYIKGIGKVSDKVLLLLESSKILNNDELERMEELA
jgi:purine-binding chemotaxis protein CheW